MPRCPSRGPDLVSTPEHLRPGFRGRTHRYDPSDFGLTGNEEWRHPRMFRNMTCKYLGANRSYSFPNSTFTVWIY